MAPIRRIGSPPSLRDNLAMTHDHEAMSLQIGCLEGINEAEEADRGDSLRTGSGAREGMRIHAKQSTAEGLHHMPFHVAPKRLNVVDLGSMVVQVACR